jgi:hypothetical protein
MNSRGRWFHMSSCHRDENESGGQTLCPLSNHQPTAGGIRLRSCAVPPLLQRSRWASMARRTTGSVSQARIIARSNPEALVLDSHAASRNHSR